MAKYRLTAPALILGKDYPTGTVIELGGKLGPILASKVEPITDEPAFKDIRVKKVSRNKKEYL